MTAPSDPRASSSLRITDTQRRPVSLALVAAAVFFVLLGAKNAWQGEWVVAGLCAIATVVALMYAHAIHLHRPNPVGDVALAALVGVVLTVTVLKRDLVGVLWAPVLMLMMHLVARRWVSLCFDAAVVVSASAYGVWMHDGDTAFRVGAILIITSAFAHIYARNADAHHRVVEQQRQHLDLLVRCAAVGSMEWRVTDDRGYPSARLATWLGLDPGATEPIRLKNQLAAEHRPELDALLAALVEGPLPPHGSRHAAPKDLRFQRADGTDIWLHAEFMALAGEDGQPEQIMATFIDISRLRAAEEDTLNALKRQQELSELRARFVAMTSHEFRTPLAAILSSAELLEHYGERLPADERLQVLKGIHDGVHRMTHMLDRILLINKADANMLEFQPRKVDLAGVLNQMAAELEPDPSARRLEVTVAPPGARPRLDPKLLQHALGNLMSNALKYSDPGAPVRVNAVVNDPWVQLTVEDRGIGIPAPDLPDLFEPFHRGANVGERKGTGLGLTLVKKSVELHGGSIAVHSQVNQGTVFQVTLRQGEPT